MSANSPTIFSPELHDSGNAFNCVLDLGARQGKDVWSNRETDGNLGLWYVCV